MKQTNYAFEERQLALQLQSILFKEFDIVCEQEIQKNPGKFSLNGTVHNSIPDLLIKPKAHLIESGKFIETIIPIEIKKFTTLDTNKFEDLMFQCHSYRFSIFNGEIPKLCLFFIDDYYEYRTKNIHLKYNNEAAKIPHIQDCYTRTSMMDKKKVETLFGRFGIGEIITNGQDYTFRVKRQVLFEKRGEQIKYKRNILNFWWGTKGNPKFNE